jgi:threonine-phosphate decarboxylase
VDIHDHAYIGKMSLRRVEDFTTGVNPLGPSNKVRYVVRKKARSLDIFPDESMRYLKAYLSKLEGVAENRLVFGAGSTHLLALLLQIVKPGVVGVLSPCSTRLENSLRLHKTEIRPIPIMDEGDGFTADAEKLCELMGDVDMMILPHPHDVTGAIIPDEKLDLLIEESDRLGKVLVVDEAYRDYTPVASPLRRAVTSRSTIILRTFSLYHALAGLRLGYGVGSLRLVDELNITVPSSLVNGLAPQGAIVSLKDKGFRARTLKFIEEEKRYLREKLGDIRDIRLIDTPCNFVLLALRDDLESILHSFRKRNILADGFIGPHGTAYLRVPVKRHKSNAFFMRALRRIMEVRS